MLARRRQQRHCWKTKDFGTSLWQLDENYTNFLCVRKGMRCLFMSLHPKRAWRSQLPLQPSEIRLVRSRDRGVFFGIVSMRVFGTGIFRPVAEDAPIGFGREPSCCEDAFVLDPELEL
jgi:hypothetical protein